jgi:hypothetical protein
MREEIKKLVENIKDSELKYDLNKGKEYKKELEFLIDELFREIENDNSEENTYILSNVFPIITKQFSRGFGIAEMLYERKKIELNKSVWSILIEKNLLRSYSVKSLNYEINPKNENLQKIFKNIVSDDDNRPILEGIDFQNNTATGTDAHKLLHIVGKKVGKFKNGTYKLYSDIVKEYSKGILQGTLSFEQYYEKNSLIDGKYPMWIKVIPHDYYFFKTFDLMFLNNIVNNILKNKLVNPITKSIAFEFENKNEKFNIGVNAEFLSQICECMLMSGHSSVNFFFSSSPSKGIFIMDEKLKFPKKHEDKFFEENYGFTAKQGIYRS